MANDKYVFNGVFNFDDEQAQKQIRQLEGIINGLTDDLERMQNEYRNCQLELEKMTSTYEFFSHAKGIDVLQEQLERFRDSASRSVDEFRAFLQTVNLNDAFGSNDYQFQDMFDRIQNGLMTSNQAILEVKTNFASLIEDNFANSDNAAGVQAIQSFSAALNEVGRTCETILSKIQNLEETGIKAVGGSVGATTNEVVSALTDIQNAAGAMHGEAQAAYEPMINLLNALTQYASIDDSKLFRVSEAFRNMSSMGQGRYGTTSVDNILRLVKQLSLLNEGGLNVRFDAKGFNELKISKASYSNLATYLPQIASANVNKLEKLSRIDLTNFNNVKVSKESLNSISQMVSALSEIQKPKGGNADSKNTSGLRVLSDEERLRLEWREAEKQHEKEVSEERKKRVAEEKAAQKARREEEEAIEREELDFLDEYYSTKKQHEKDLDKGNQEAVDLMLKQIALSQKIASLEWRDADAIKHYPELYNALELVDKQIENLSEGQRKYASRTKEVTEAVEKLRLEEERRGNVAAAQWDKLKDKASQYLERNKQAERNKEYSEQADAIRNLIKSGTPADFAKLNEMLGKAGDIIHRNGLETEKWYQKMQKTLGSRMRSLLAGVVSGKVAQAFRDIYVNVSEINAAMTQLRIVTGATDMQMERFLSSSISLSKELGASVKDVLSSIEVFSRLGYDLSDSSVLAKYATIMSNVASVSSDEANTGITSIIKGYGIDASDAEHVADVLIEVGQKYAVSAGELMEAYSNAGAALKASNTSFEKSAGLIAAANASVQDASTVGTALKTISARIRSSTADLETLGESTDGLAQGFSEYAKEIQALTGFNILVEGTTDTYKDLYDIFEGISKTWDTLSDTQQSRIAEILGGTRQLQVVSSIFQNWSDAAGAYCDAMDSAGVSTKAMDEYVDSIQGRLGVLKASFAEFSKSLLNGEVVKAGISVLTGFVNALSGITQVGNGVIVGIFAVSTALFVLNAAFKATQKAIVKTIRRYAELAGVQATGAITAKMFGAAMLQASSVGLMGFLTAIPRLIAAFVYYIYRARSATKATLTWKAACDALKLNPVVAAVEAIIAVVAGLVALTVTLANATTKAKEKAVDAAKTAKEAWKNAKEEAESLNDKLSETTNRIKELQEAANNGTITLVEENELNKLKSTVSLLRSQQDLLKNTSNASKVEAEKAAAKAVSAILNEKLSDAYIEENNTFWMGFARVASSIFSFGTTDAFSDFGISDWSIKETSASKYVNGILENWETATEQQRNYVLDFYSQLREQSETLTYYTGNDLKEWQKNVNLAYDTYYAYLHKIAIAQGDYESVWKSLFSMERFEGVTEALDNLANNEVVSQESITRLYHANDAFADMVDYLRDLGLFSWNDATSINGLINQINQFKKATEKITEQSFVSYLDKIEERFNSLKQALKDITEYGIVSASSIKTILEKYPVLLKYFKMTTQGYILSDDYSSLSTMDILRDFAKNSLQDDVEVLAKCTEGTEEYATAQNNLNMAIAVMATLLRESQIEKETAAYESQKDALSDQLDQYKEFIDLRKKLLSTYQEELDYQKQLEQKQRDVVKLQTKLAVARLDKSASGQARVRELEEELSKAQESLDEFTLEHAIDVLTEQLDNQYEEYESFINAKIETITDAINSIASSIAGAATNTDKIIEDLLNEYRKTHKEEQSSKGGNGEYDIVANAALEKAQAFVNEHKLLESDRDLWENIPEYKKLADEARKAGADLSKVRGLRNLEPEFESSSKDLGDVIQGDKNLDAMFDNLIKRFGSTATRTGSVNHDLNEKKITLAEYADSAIKDSTGNTFYPFVTYSSGKRAWLKLGEGYTMSRIGTNCYIKPIDRSPFYDIPEMYPGVYHTGGFVGGSASLNSNEEFAKLLKGEFVSTPAQMRQFMKKTLPDIAGYSSTMGNEFNAPLIEISCDSVTTEALPGLKDIVNEAVAVIRKQLDSGMSRNGAKKKYATRLS